MYSILLSLTLSLLLGFSGVFLDWWHWGWGIFFTLLLSVVIWVLIARRVGKQIQPAMEQVQRQMQQGHVKLAIQTLEDMLPLGKWVPMLHGQVIAQMGIHGADDFFGRQSHFKIEMGHLALGVNASVRAPGAGDPLRLA